MSPGDYVVRKDGGNFYSDAYGSDPREGLQVGKVTALGWSLGFFKTRHTVQFHDGESGPLQSAFVRPNDLRIATEEEIKEWGGRW